MANYATTSTNAIKNAPVPTTANAQIRLAHFRANARRVSSNLAENAKTTTSARRARTAATKTQSAKTSKADTAANATPNLKAVGNFAALLMSAKRERTSVTGKQNAFLIFPVGRKTSHRQRSIFSAKVHFIVWFQNL